MTTPASRLVEITYSEAWRRADWPDEVPARPAWFVTCSVCGPLGDGHGYSLVRSARMVATRHQRRSRHDAPPVASVPLEASS